MKLKTAKEIRRQLTINARIATMKKRNKGTRYYKQGKRSYEIMKNYDQATTNYYYGENSHISEAQQYKFPVFVKAA